MLLYKFYSFFLTTFTLVLFPYLSFFSRERSFIKKPVECRVKEGKNRLIIKNFLKRPVEPVELVATRKANQNKKLF